MALSRKQIIQLRERDPYCYHCGEYETVPHHRRNRAMGGSKILDRLDNLIMVCAEYNGNMESNAHIASQARDFGHKLGQWDGFEMPVFDQLSKIWYQLGNDGSRATCDAPNYLI